jgi:hypothetical protein
MNTLTFGQNLIGYTGRDIQKYMKENRSEMNSEKVNNNKFNYLKYTDNYETQTLLFFIDKDSVCKSVRLIINKNMKAAKVKEYNTVYKPAGENTWIDRRDNYEYVIKIEDNKYSCIITIESDK